MKRTWCRWMWIAMFAGCGATDDPIVDPPDRPDAEPVIEGCEHDSCGLPSDDPCCADTTCVDWDLLGPVECAAQCETNGDCASGCCVELTNGEHTCAPEEACDPGGAVPDYLCNELLECGEIGNYAQCVASITTCVEGLSNDQQRQWIDQMRECGSAADDNSCDSYYTYCWLNYVPWC